MRGSTHAAPASTGPATALLVAAAVLLLGACGCQTYTTQSASMTAAWRSGRAEQAAREFGQRAAGKAGSIDSVIWHLEAGAAWRAAGSYSNSNQHFEAAAVKIADYEQRAKVRLGSEALATMSNQQNLPYEGRAYDKILLHTYRALNYLAAGAVERARPAIIKAYQCEQDAVAENQRRIEQAREAEQQSKDRATIAQAKANPGFAGQLEGITRPLEGFRVYADYVNPFTVYLDGLYFLHAGSGGADLERALKSLRRVLEVAGANPHVQADVAAAEGLLAGRAPQPCGYVFFETGCAASRQQVRIDIPIFVTRLSYVGAAFPKLEFHPDYAPALTVHAGAVTETTALVADMDAIVALDFKNEWPVIVTKTVISTIAKAVANYAVNDAANRSDNALGLLSQILTGVAQWAINIADTRSWTTLPKQFQVARVPIPPDRKLVLTTPNGSRAEAALVDGRVPVLYVRSVTSSGPLLINQFKLK